VPDVRLLATQIAVKRIFAREVCLATNCMNEVGPRLSTKAPDSSPIAAPLPCEIPSAMHMPPAPVDGLVTESFANGVEEAEQDDADSAALNRPKNLQNS
jgi:hypothetical protein